MVYARHVSLGLLTFAGAPLDKPTIDACVVHLEPIAGKDGMRASFTARQVGVLLETHAARVDDRLKFPSCKLSAEDRVRLLSAATQNLELHPVGSPERVFAEAIVKMLS